MILVNVDKQKMIAQNDSRECRQTEETAERNGAPRGRRGFAG